MLAFCSSGGLKGTEGSMFALTTASLDISASSSFADNVSLIDRFIVFLSSLGFMVFPIFVDFHAAKGWVKMTKPYWWRRSTLLTSYSLARVPWHTPFMWLDRNGLGSTWWRFTRFAWFIGHVLSSIKKQDEPVSLKAPTAFAAHQRYVGIRIYKELPSAPTNRILIMVEGLPGLVNRTRGHLYFSTGVGGGDRSCLVEAKF